MTVNKDVAIQVWAKENPFLTDSLMFDFLNENQGSCSLSPLAEETVVKQYTDGAKVKQYTFAIQVMFMLSSNVDDVNTENMFTLRKWQNWIEQQEKIKNYPDFGERCSNYMLENLSNMPQMAMRYENGMAKYQFFARLKYLEE